MPAGFGRTRQTSDRGVYNVVYEYRDEQAGRYAGRAAVRLCQSIVETGSYPESELRQDLATWVYVGDISEGGVCAV